MKKFDKKCSIYEEKNIPSPKNAIIQAYWPFDGKKFKNTPAQVAKHFDLNSEELYNIIAAYSKISVYDHCSDCGMEMVTDVDCQLDFLKAYQNDGICENCETKKSDNEKNK